MSSEAREFEFNKTWFVEGDFPTLKFMVAYYLGSRDFFLLGVFFPSSIKLNDDVMN